jgi:hypothetical protein
MCSYLSQVNPIFHTYFFKIILIYGLSSHTQYMSTQPVHFETPHSVIFSNYMLFHLSLAHIPSSLIMIKHTIEQIGVNYRIFWLMAMVSRQIW